jgi:Raf kinase inhibitor-like YbhB/YbcL family protein
LHFPAAPAQKGKRPMARFMVSALVFAVTAFAAGLAAGPPAAALPREAVFTLTSSDFTDGGVISPRFTCDKDGDSPPLHWENVPEHVKSYALAATDPDAPGGVYTHWIVYNMPDNTRDLAAGANAKSDLGIKAAQGVNGAGKIGWAPPCPPSGDHHYVFRVYALDTEIALAGATLDKKALDAAIEGHVLAQAELTGRYTRHK